MFLFLFLNPLIHCNIVLSSIALFNLQNISLYIYFLKQSVLAEKQVLMGNSLAFASFGYAVANVGDLNLDGFPGKWIFSKISTERLSSPLLIFVLFFVPLWKECLNKKYTLSHYYSNTIEEVVVDLNNFPLRGGRPLQRGCFLEEAFSKKNPKKRKTVF